jgi:hypothetical protein
MTGIDYDGNAGQFASHHPVMIHQVIMGMQYVGSIMPKLLRNLPHGT